MAMMKSKSGFVFTFLSLFLVLIIYFFADINLQTQTYTIEDDFKESRIERIDSNLEYFKTTYLHEVYEVSLDATLKALLSASSDSTFYNSYQNNYTQFIAYVNEGMINGSFDSTPQPSLDDKTITDLISSFKSSFDKRNRGNFTFESYSLAIYEDDPFYVSLESEFGVEAELDDNLSYWKFNDSVKIKRPVFNYLDPAHAITLSQGTDAPLLQSVESRYSASIDWTLDLLNETIADQSATTYRDPSYKYTLGNSFLQGLMGDFSGSYEHTFGFWSFDYDEEEQGVYDTSLIFENGVRQLNSKLLLDFSTCNSTHTPDLSDYEHNASIFGGVTCSNLGVNNNASQLDGIDDYMTSTFDFGEEKSTDFSFSIWVKTTSSSPMALIGKTHRAFSSGSLDSNIGLEMNSSGNVGWRFKFNGSSDEYHFSERNINDGFWHHVTGVRRGEKFELYIDGRRDIILEKEDYYIDNGEREFQSGLSVDEPLHIGAYRPTTASADNFFQGEFDEIGVYDRALKDVEITRLYEAGRVLNKDYVDSYHGKGLLFDGIDDRVQIDTQSEYVNFFRNNDFSIEIWFTPQKESGDLLSYGDQFFISYNISANEMYIDDNNNIITIPAEFSTNHPNYFAMTYNSSEIPPQRLKVYKETSVVESGSVWNPNTASSYDLIIGGNNSNSEVNSNFGGIIDEVRISNTTLSRSEVLENYYNFNSQAKGCCNYIIPLNPHATGFNTSAYSDIIPYSTTPFARHHIISDTLNGITLYNVTNITSMQTNKEFHNFHVDSCQILVYDILAYDESGNAVSNVAAGTDDGDCLELVKRGIY